MIRTPIAVLALSALATLPAAGQPTSNGRRAPAAPCTTASRACTEWLVLGGGPGRSLVYRTYPLDTRNDAITRVVVSIHGAGVSLCGHNARCMYTSEAALPLIFPKE